MSMSAHLHNIDAAEVIDIAMSNALLRIASTDGSHVNIYIPYAQAKAMADAFNAHKPQPATVEAEA